MNIKALLPVTCILLGLCASAATDVVWTGGGAGDVNIANNWDPQVVPHGKNSDYVAVFTNSVTVVNDLEWFLAGIRVTGASTVTFSGSKKVFSPSSGCGPDGFVVDVATGGTLDVSAGYYYAKQRDILKTGGGTFKTGARFGFTTTGQNEIRNLCVRAGTVDASLSTIYASGTISVGDRAVLKCKKNGMSTAGGLMPCLALEAGGTFDGNREDQFMLGIQGGGAISNVGKLSLSVRHSGLVFSGTISASTLCITNSSTTEAGAYVVFGADNTLKGVSEFVISGDTAYPIPDVRFAAGIGDFMIGGATWPTGRMFYDMDGMPVTFWRVSNVLYVDDDNYGNSGDGKTPSSAFGTLAEALAAATSYSLIRVLPGTYDKGEMAGSGDMTPSRALVPGKVRLVAVGSPEETIIKGASSTDASRDALGNGPGGVRCVRLSAHASIRGFTLTGGRVAVTGWTSGDNGSQGGGVSASAEGTIISDCIITNNAALYGAAGDNGSYVRCRVFDNHTSRNEGVAFYGRANLYGCVVDRNATGASQCAYYSYYPPSVAATAQRVEILNSTFGPNENLSVCFTQETDWQRALICNTVILGGISTPTATTGQYRNCVLVGSRATEVDHDADCLARVDLAEAGEKLDYVGLDSGLKPVKGGLLVDRGLNGYFEPVDDQTAKVYGGVDVVGCTRVRNGTIDIGAYEYDCSRDYADQVGKARKMPIVHMSAGVTTNDSGAVCLENLDVVKASVIMPGCYSIHVRVVGDGELTFFAGDAATKRVIGEQDGGVEVLIAAADEPVPVRFSFEGAGRAEILRIDCPRQGIMLIVR